MSFFFLEKSRVCIQNGGESNFNIFYVLIQQHSKDLQSKLHLNGSFFYLNHMDITKAMGTPSLHLSFEQIDEALTKIGYSNTNKSVLYSCIAAILHIGNIQFEEKKFYKH